jgi:hypothetical protein
VVLPIRALLFALITEPMVLVAVQVLYGISGIILDTTFGRTEMTGDARCIAAIDDC